MVSLLLFFRMSSCYAFAFYLYEVNRNYRALIPSTRFLLNLYNKKGVKRKKN